MTAFLGFLGLAALIIGGVVLLFWSADDGAAQRRLQQLDDERRRLIRERDRERGAPPVRVRPIPPDDVH